MDIRNGRKPATQPYIGSPIAEENADAELVSYAGCSNDMDLLVNPENEVRPDEGRVLTHRDAVPITLICASRRKSAPSGVNLEHAEIAQPLTGYFTLSPPRQTPSAVVLLRMSVTSSPGAGEKWACRRYPQRG